MSSKSSIRRFMTQAFRRRQGTIRNPSPARLRIESLESRITPAGLQPLPTIFQPEVSAGVPIFLEGQSVLTGEVLLEFGDSVGPSALSHLTATITWNDGSPATTATSSSATTANIVDTGLNDGLGNELFQVVALGSGAHVYEEAAPGKQFSVSVADDGSAAVGGPGPNTGASTPLNSGNGVADATLTDTTAAQPAANGVEGVTLNNVLLASFDDGNPVATAADYTVTVNFTGTPTFVGTPSFTVVPNGVSGGVSHWNVVASGLTFTEPGSFAVASVKVVDVGGSTVTTANGPAFSVSDAPLRIDATGTSITTSEAAPTGPVVLATFTDANPGDHTADFTTAINWGDGTPLDTTTGVISFNAATGVYTVTGSHIYPEEGTFFASVHVTDDDGFSVDTHIGLNDADVVVTAPAQTAGAWYPDRFPPNGFVGGQTAQGRTGVIDQTISAADANGVGSRNPPDNGFDDFQGRKYDLPPGTNYVTMDLFVPAVWAGLNQQDPNGNPNNFGSLASLWGTGVDGANAIASFPIIGFNNLGTNNGQVGGAAGFQVFDGTNGWTNVPGFTGFNNWYQLSYGLDPSGNIDYFVNGVHVYTDTTPTGTVAFSNEILEGYNGGNT
ncbi:MAG TPA: hypothetical protein VGI99_06000, partial [Gemmataceae bacterium]